MTRQEELEKAGWAKMFARGGRRLEEFVELYEGMGYEVHLEPLTREDFPSKCEGCSALANCQLYKMIYIRKREGSDRSDSA
jgi:hypothetical protein